MEAVHTLAPSKGIPVRNVWFLLLYAWGMGNQVHLASKGIEDAPNLLGLLAKVLAASTRQLIRHRLERAFQTQDAELPGLRGRILFAPTLKRNLLAHGRTCCRYADLGVDTLPNRILKATLQALSTHPAMDAGANHEAAVAVRHDLQASLRLLAEVTPIQLSGADFSRLALGRNQEAYRLPMAVCALVYRHGLPEEASGDTLTLALLRDELVFSRLFEAFIRNFYVLHLPGAKVQREILRWPVETEEPLLPTMQTDISITWPEPSLRRLVVDAKYYRRTLGRRPQGQDRFHAQHIYQIYAYLRSQEGKPEDLHQHSSGMVLYPVNHVDGELDRTMVLQGHRLRIATLNLGLANWGDIHDRLLTLAS